MLFKQLETLQKARETYGYKNQISVSTEELNELAAVLSKYVRYETHEKAVDELYDRVLDEYADVLIVLDHIKNIFEFKGSEISSRIDVKLERLKGWLSKSESLEQTTVDRELIGEPGPCSNCEYESLTFSEEPCATCRCRSNWTKRKD